jgi:hypothetical protein
VITTLIRPAAAVAPPVRPDRAPDGEVGRLPRRRSAERLAVFTLTAAFVFQPILRPAGPGNSSPVDVFTLLALVAFGLWAGVSRRRLRAPYALAVALWIGAGAASGLVSPLPGTAFLDLAIEVLLFGWCLTVANVLSRPAALRCALAAWCWSGVGWAALVAVAHAAHITPLEGFKPADGNRVLFTFGDPNYAAAYWVVTLLVIHATGVPQRRWIRWTGYALLVYAVVLTESNGGFLELAIGIAFVIAARVHRRRGWVGVAAFVLTVGVTLGTFFTLIPMSSIRTWARNSNQSFLVNSLGRSDNSTAQRGQLISESFQLWQRTDGILGLGPMSTKPLLTQWQYPYAKEAHDDYIAALVERGPIGALGLVVLLCGIVAAAAAVLRRPLPPAFAAAVPHPAGLVAGALALGVAATYYEILHFRFAWALFGILAVLARAGRDSRTPRRARTRTS